MLDLFVAGARRLEVPQLAVNCRFYSPWHTGGAYHFRAYSLKSSAIVRHVSFVQLLHRVRLRRGPHISLRPDRVASMLSLLNLRPFIDSLPLEALDLSSMAPPTATDQGYASQQQEDDPLADVKPDVHELERQVQLSKDNWSLMVPATPQHFFDDSSFSFGTEMCVESPYSAVSSGHHASLNCHDIVVALKSSNVVASSPIEDAMRLGVSDSTCAPLTASFADILSSPDVHQAPLAIKNAARCVNYDKCEQYVDGWYAQCGFEPFCGFCKVSHRERKRDRLLNCCRRCATLRA